MTTAVVHPHRLEVILVEDEDLTEWADRELRSLGPITNPDYRPEWAITNLIGLDYRFAEITTYTTKEAQR